MQTSQRSSVRRYGVAVLTVGLALLVTFQLDIIATRTPFALFFSAVVVSTWYGGRKPGLLTIALSASVSHYFIIPPTYSLALKPNSAFQIGTFVMLALLTNWLTSARQESEKSLRESEARLRTIVESLAEGLTVSDLDGRMLHFNRAALGMHGFASLDECRRHLTEFADILELSTMDGRVLPVDQWPLARVLRGENLHDLEIRIRHTKTGLQRIFNYGGTLVYDERGQPMVGVVTIIDVTERKRADEALAEHARILDLAPVLIRDMSDRIIFWNKGAEQMYGWSSDEAVGQITYNLFQTTFPQPLEEIKAKLFAYGHWEGELIKIRRDGERLVVASHWVLHKNEHGEPRAILEVNNDITERKQAEEEVRRLNEELEERVQERTAQLQAANKELEAFSYSVSHDLRAPLRHINGFSQALLEDYSDKLDDEGRGYLREVRGASQEMARLIDDVLNLTRVTRSEMRRDVVNLSEVAREVVSGLRNRDSARRAAVHIEDGLVTRGDRRLLQIMLVNLLGNAWKFTSKGERAEIAFGREQKEGEAAYFVRDNGAGFDMTYADKLFGAFQRLHTVNEFEGTGIGLATVQRIVHRHGGHVWAEGAVNRGATFYFTLPDFKEKGHERQSDLTG